MGVEFHGLVLRTFWILDRLTKTLIAHSIANVAITTAVTFLSSALRSFTP